MVLLSWETQSMSSYLSRPLHGCRSRSRTLDTEEPESGLVAPVSPDRSRAPFPLKLLGKVQVVRIKKRFTLLLSLIRRYLLRFAQKIQRFALSSAVIQRRAGAKQSCWNWMQSRSPSCWEACESLVSP